jgi:hypothetical protein
MRGHDRIVIVKPNNKKSIRHPNTISLQPDDLFAFRFGAIVLQSCVSTSAKLHRHYTGSPERGSASHVGNAVGLCCSSVPARTDISAVASRARLWHSASGRRAGARSPTPARPPLPPIRPRVGADDLSYGR